MECPECASKFNCVYVSGELQSQPIIIIKYTSIDDPLCTLDLESRSALDTFKTEVSKYASQI